MLVEWAAVSVYLSTVSAKSQLSLLNMVQCNLSTRSLGPQVPDVCLHTLLIFLKQLPSGQKPGQPGGRTKDMWQQLQAKSRTCSTPVAFESHNIHQYPTTCATLLWEILGLEDTTHGVPRADPGKKQTTRMIDARFHSRVLNFSFCRVLHLKKPFKLLWALASWMELRTGESWFMNWIRGTNWCSPSMFDEFQRFAVAVLFSPFGDFLSFSFQDLTEAQAKSLLECLGLGPLSSTCISKPISCYDSRHVWHVAFRLAPVAFNRHRWRFETAKELWRFQATWYEDKHVGHVDEWQ